MLRQQASPNLHELFLVWKVVLQIGMWKEGDHNHGQFAEWKLGFYHFSTPVPIGSVKNAN